MGYQAATAKMRRKVKRAWQAPLDHVVRREKEDQVEQTLITRTGNRARVRVVIVRDIGLIKVCWFHRDECFWKPSRRKEHLTLSELGYIPLLCHVVPLDKSLVCVSTKDSTYIYFQVCSLLNRHRNNRCFYCCRVVSLLKPMMPLLSVLFTKETKRGRL